MYRPLHIEVNLAALRNNLSVVKGVVGENTKIIATVKQSAYGHGLIPVVRELVGEGVDCFGVGSIEEAILLRNNGFNKESILVLAATLPEFAASFIEYRIIPTVADIRFARAINEAAYQRGVVFPVHVKIDTGMGRLGLYYKDAHSFIKELKQLKNIFLEGLYTHFPSADTDCDFTNYQINAFNEFIKTLVKEDIYFKYCHCANSIGLANYPRSHFNMVRPGLILYGVKPARNLKLEIEPVLSLKSKIVFIKKIDKGRSVSYGRAYIAEKPTYIATVAAGYADGYPWNLSGTGKVIVKDGIFNIAGRVCMDHIMIDLGDRQDIDVGEEVVLIGKKNTLEITAEDVADWAKTIPYEIVSCLSLKIPRIYRLFSEDNDFAVSNSIERAK
jgi:alanine racemase